jgi:predicted anti-sigma-YlaC factor YlaD
MDNEQIPFLESASLSCSDVEELMDCYLDKEMVSALVSKFEEHLKTCESCRDLVYDCRHIIEVARDLDNEPIPKEVSLRLREALATRVGHNVIPHRRKLVLLKNGSAKAPR